MLNSKGWAICFKFILYPNLLLGAESSKEGCIGVWILGAPEGSSWPAGAWVHVAAGLGPPRCCVPALSCCTTAQTGQHRWLPVCSFWSQYCSHAHRLLQLSQNSFFFSQWTVYLSLCGLIEYDFCIVYLLADQPQVCLMVQDSYFVSFFTRS